MAGNGYGGAAIENCYLDATCSDPTVGGLGCNAGGHNNCRYCGFKHYQDCPQPGDPVPEAEVDVPQLALGCGGLPAAATCTTNPRELCFKDLSCEDPEVDHLGCNAGGHFECRFCGFHHFDPCPIQDTPQSLLAALDNSYTQGHSEDGDNTRNIEILQVPETSNLTQSAGLISRSLVFVGLAALGAAVAAGIVHKVRRDRVPAEKWLDDEALPPARSWLPTL